MAKKEKEKEESASQAPSDKTVKVKALKNINTSLYGNIKEGKEGELPANLAEQLYLNGDCEIVE
jgi:hypothetical protein